MMNRQPGFQPSRRSRLSRVCARPIPPDQIRERESAELDLELIEQPRLGLDGIRFEPPRNPQRLWLVNLPQVPAAPVSDRLATPEPGEEANTLIQFRRSTDIERLGAANELAREDRPIDCGFLPLNLPPRLTSRNVGISPACARTTYTPDWLGTRPASSAPRRGTKPAKPSSSRWA